MVDESYSAPSVDEGYAGPTIAAAVLMTLFFPLISLIVALLLLGRERNPVKRSSLRTWVIATAVWLVAWILIAIGLLAVASSGTEVGPIQTP